MSAGYAGEVPHSSSIAKITSIATVDPRENIRRDLACNHGRDTYHEIGDYNER
jgi:hypothetical protein